MEQANIYVDSPEGGSTIEACPGATLETAREAAALLMRSAKQSAAPKPPTYLEVMQLIEPATDDTQ